MSWSDEDVAGPVPSKAWSDEDVVVSKPTSLGQRILTGLADPIIGAGQIMDRVLVNPIRQAISPGASSMSDVVQARDAEYVAPEGLDLGRMAGNVINPVSWVGGGPVLKKSLQALASRGAQVGAIQAGLAPTTSEDFWTEKAKQAGMGAAFGGVIPIATRAGASVVGGLPATPEARELMRQGVQPTVGQGLGGIANDLEQRLTSVPILGDVIQGARNRAQNDFQTRALQRATTGSTDIPNISFQVAKTVEDANKLASQLYDDVVPALKPHMDAVTKAHQGLQTAVQNPRLTAEGRKQLQSLTKSYLANFGKMSGADIKQLDSQMGYDIRRYAQGDPNHKAIADGLQEIQAGFREGLEAGLPPELQGNLKEANKIFRNLIPFNKAASARADEKVLPRALQKASARQARVDSSRYMDELIDPAVAVLPNTVPDSGTAGRMLLNLATLGGGAATGYLPLAASLGAGAVGAVGATRPVQKAMLGGYGPQAAARAVVPKLDKYVVTQAQILAALLRGRMQEQKE